MRLVRRILPDLTSWHSSPTFRLLLIAGLTTNFGNFLTYVAIPLQIMRLTGDPLAIGMLGLAQLFSSPNGLCTT